MDLIYIGITVALFLLTWGLMKICEVPHSGSSERALRDQPSSAEEKKFPHTGSQTGGKS